MVCLQKSCNLNSSYSFNLNCLILCINVHQEQQMCKTYIFAQVGQVNWELWPFDFARMRSGIDFRKLNINGFHYYVTKTILFWFIWVNAVTMTGFGGIFCHLQCQFQFQFDSELYIQVFCVERVKHWYSKQYRQLQSTLDISKLWGLFVTSSNYPKCKLICTSGNLDL